MNWEVQGSTEIMFALFICAIIHTYLFFFYHSAVAEICFNLLAFKKGRRVMHSAI